MRIAHFILTRFNLAFGSRPVDASWLGHRMELFRAFCAPSVVGQATRPFRWLIFVDPSTPDGCRREIERLASPVGAVHEALGLEPSAVVALIRRHLEPEVTHVLTTSLDNDDALASDFVATLQAACTPRDFEVVNMRVGLRLILRTNRLYSCCLESNPFVSVLEEASRARTVWQCLPHSTMSSRYRDIRSIDTKPMWMQVIHDRNVSNSGAWGLLRTQPSELDRFRVSWTGSLDDGPIGFENLVRRAERALIRAVPTAARPGLRRLLDRRSWR